jgi:hypothetical protein
MMGMNAHFVRDLQGFEGAVIMSDDDSTPASRDSKGSAR